MRSARTRTLLPVASCKLAAANQLVTRHLRRRAAHTCEQRLVERSVERGKGNLALSEHQWPDRRGILALENLELVPTLDEFGEDLLASFGFSARLELLWERMPTPHCTDVARRKKISVSRCRPRMKRSS